MIIFVFNHYLNQIKFLFVFAYWLAAATPSPIEYSPSYRTVNLV